MMAQEQTVKFFDSLEFSQAGTLRWGQGAVIQGCACQLLEAGLYTPRLRASREEGSEDPG